MDETASQRQQRRREELLARQIANEKSEQMKKEREVQAICENDPELRDLQAKIQVRTLVLGYMYYTSVYISGRLC